MDLEGLLLLGESKRINDFLDLLPYLIGYFCALFYRGRIRLILSSFFVLKELFFFFEIFRGLLKELSCKDSAEFLLIHFSLFYRLPLTEFLSLEVFFVTVFLIVLDLLGLLILGCRKKLMIV